MSMRKDIEGVEENFYLKWCCVYKDMLDNIVLLSLRMIMFWLLDLIIIEVK